MSNLLVEVYTKKDCNSFCKFYKDKCALCRDAIEIIFKVNSEIPFDFKEVDIDSSEELNRAYREDIPTVFINGKKAFKFKVDENEFRKKVRKEIIKAGLMRLRKQHYS